MTTDLDPPPDAPTASPEVGIGRPVAGAAGLLAVGVALGVGDLVAGLVAPPSSPVLVVGDQAIRLTPEWLKEFATSTFGVHDKQVLLAGMAVVIAVIAVLGGLLSRRSPAPGIALVVVLGLVGATCAAASPTFTPVALVASFAALVAGVATFVALHTLARRAATAAAPAPAVPAPGTVDPDPTRPRRRLVLGLLGALAGAGITAFVGRSLAAAQAAEASRAAVGPLPSPTPGAATPPPGADFATSGTPTWITPNADFYRIDTALQVPQISTSDYSLRIHGMVDREIVLDYDQLRGRALLEAPITMTCVSNDVGGNLISNAVFVGVRAA